MKPLKTNEIHNHLPQKDLNNATLTAEKSSTGSVFEQTQANRSDQHSAGAADALKEKTSACLTQAKIKQNDQNLSEEHSKRTFTTNSNREKQSENVGVDIQPGFIREKQFQQVGLQMTPAKSPPKHTKVWRTIICEYIGLAETGLHIM